MIKGMGSTGLTLALREIRARISVYESGCGPTGICFVTLVTR